ncbi:PmoA family protein [Sinomonas sp. G460-2]|uniref:DUF6807 domain-containing protein n=1 Tax=Sinomonas sp. G460-2 TaxID=3393464 RepID=UPI0039EFE0E0
MSAALPTWQHDEEAGTVTVTLDGTDVAVYTYRATDAQRESPRPYFHPLRTRAGETVTVFRPHDHLWHKGLAWSLPHVSGENFWGGPTFRRDEGYVQLDNNGRMEHTGFAALETAEDGRFVLTHELVWHRQDGTPVVAETRTVSVLPAEDPSSWTLVFESDMENISGEDLRIGSPTTEGRPNAGYGGLFWRGPRSFTGGTIVGPGGATGETLRGTRHPWAAFVGRHDETDAASTILIADYPGNGQHPPEWFARSEPFGCLGPAPFFSEEVPFGAGEHLVNRYAVVISDGAADAPRLEELASAARGAFERTTAAAASGGSGS